MYLTFYVSVSTCISWSRVECTSRVRRFVQWRSIFSTMRDWRGHVRTCVLQLWVYTRARPMNYVCAHSRDQHIMFNIMHYVCTILCYYLLCIIYNYNMYIPHTYLHHIHFYIHFIFRIYTRSTYTIIYIGLYTYLQTDTLYVYIC